MLKVSILNYVMQFLIWHLCCAIRTHTQLLKNLCTLILVLFFVIDKGYWRRRIRRGFGVWFWLWCWLCFYFLRLLDRFFGFSLGLFLIRIFGLKAAQQIGQLLGYFLGVFSITYYHRHQQSERQYQDFDN